VYAMCAFVCVQAMSYFAKDLPRLLKQKGEAR
jgi:hypothetical protein